MLKVVLSVSLASFYVRAECRIKRNAQFPGEASLVILSARTNRLIDWISNCFGIEFASISNYPASISDHFAIPFAVPRYSGFPSVYSSLSALLINKSLWFMTHMSNLIAALFISCNWCMFRLAWRVKQTIETLQPSMS